MPPDRQYSPVLRGVVALAAFVVVVAGLKAAGEVLLPIVFATFLSILALPGVTWLMKMKVPRWIAIPVVVLVITAVLAGVTGIVAETVRSFTNNIGQYEQAFQDLVGQGRDLALRLGLHFDQTDLQDLQPTVMMRVLGQSLNAVVGVLSQLLIVIVTLLFMLFEASELEDKARVAFGTRERPLGPFTDTTAQVQRYLLIKTIASFATGVFATLGCMALGVDFPVMWGLIAFLFNYVPSIGSFVAAVPPTLLAVVQLGPGYALAVVLLYLAINVSIGNFLEPRFHGRSLGLSPLVVFLSLLFWGWVWGPVGMLFSVPITVIAKLFLESHEDTRWLAVLLGSPKDVEDLAQRIHDPRKPVHDEAPTADVLPDG